MIFGNKVNIKMHEREVENILEQELRELGWIVDVRDPLRKVY